MARKKKAATVAVAAEPVKQEPFFYKDQVVASKRFAKDRDLVRAILKPGVEYTLSEVEAMIEKFKKGKVN